MTEPFWHEIGLDRVSFISGMIGGFLSLRWLVPISPWGGAFAVLFAGLVANYSAEPVHQHFAIRGLHQGGIGMFIGLFSLSIAAAIFKGLSELQLAEVIKGVFSRWTGGGQK